VAGTSHPATPALPFSQVPVASPAPGVININTAAAAELDQLKGIGPALAQRIIQHRSQNGPFRSTDDLLHVKGIGPKILRDNFNRLTVN
jgi:competence protein ComEA